MKKELKKAFEKSLAKGWGMRKLISASESGLFYYKPATYDDRKVYTIKQFEDLTKQGFYLKSDPGYLALNILWMLF